MAQTPKHKQGLDKQWNAIDQHEQLNAGAIATLRHGKPSRDNRRDIYQEHGRQKRKTPWQTDKQYLERQNRASVAMGHEQRC